MWLFVPGLLPLVQRSQVGSIQSLHQERSSLYTSLQSLHSNTLTLTTFFAYSGFDLINTLADEAKNASKSVPLSLNSALTFCIFTYAVVSISLSGMTEFHKYGGDIAMPKAFEAIGLNWMAYIIYVSAFMGITATCFNSVLG